MEPNRKVRKQGLEHFIKFVRELPSPSPQAMFQALEEHGYRGQDSARRALCLMAYRHVKRIKRIYIDGIDRAESEKVLENLFEMAEDPAIIYEHVWQVGDLLMWDNLACLHARTDWPSKQRRTLRRCTVEGDALY